MGAIQALDQLAKRVGIEEGWWDFFGKWREVPEGTRRVFLTAMGFDVSTPEAAAHSLNEFDLRPWRRWLEPVKVFMTGDADPWVSLTLPAYHDKDRLKWEIIEESGSDHPFYVQTDTLEWIEERFVDGRMVKRWKLRLPFLPLLGYHSLVVHVPNGPAFTMRIIVAPEQAYRSPSTEAACGCWGVSTQIYALRNANDWGVGTYKALEDTAVRAARLGAACVGVNPLHALFPEQPERFSPYAPSSRRFLATHFIDVESMPEFGECPAAKRLFNSPGFQANLARLRGYPLVDYVGVAQLQRPILTQLYQHFVSKHRKGISPRGQAFREFLTLGGVELETFCLFEIVRQTMVAKGHSGYWRHWPAAWQDPQSAECRTLLNDHREEVEYFAWLQFVADEQLARAHRAGRDAGSPIGLYRDLGVGLAGDGAEAWCGQKHLALGVSVGAPPDPLAPKGQDWGLLPFSPLALYESGYAPFIAVMSENMRHAGAMRLDHAMSLQRLYWVPPGMSADNGAYVRYPVDDLFALVALESQRHRCLVIGEDLGNVPEGFRERMDRFSLFTYRVMIFEKTSPTEFKAGDSYDIRALTTFGTHDLPSLRGWWDGADIDVRERLHLYPQDEMVARERENRTLDREQILKLLQDNNLLPADFVLALPLDDTQTRQLCAALYRFLAGARSRLMMVQIEDVLGLKMQMNVPGTIDQHPNWRYRFPLDADAIFADERMVSLADMLTTVRPCAAQKGKTMP